MELREDLEFKEEEFDKARYTTEMIEYRNETLKKQLDNVSDRNRFCFGMDSYCIWVDLTRSFIFLS